ncbi:MAG: methionine--tRNA ligase subunit beta [Deltaproteobacteria bacterium]
MEETPAQIAYDDFRKVVLKIATVKQVEPHPNADRLWVLTVDAGEGTRTIVAGIKPFYAAEQLVGRQVVLVANLAPAVIRGVESCGMLLAASDEAGIAVLSADRHVREGSLVK